MKKVCGILMLLVLVNVSFVLGYESNVIFQGEMGSFTGGYLKIKSSDSSSFGNDKIYPSEFLTNVGIIKFHIETVLPEVDFMIRLIKDGSVVADIEKGPYFINGTDIEIDLRQKVKAEVISEIVANESEVNESEVLENVTANVSGEAVVEDLNVTDGDGFLKGSLDAILMTGKAIIVTEDGGVNFLGIGAVLVLIIGALIFMTRRGDEKVFKKKSFKNENDDKLSEMQKKVRETEGKISKIKKDREKQAQMVALSAKLEADKRELALLEAKEQGDSEKIEDAD